MSVNDMIKKSVLNSFSQYNVPKMALALLVALLVGIVIYCVVWRSSQGLMDEALDAESQAAIQQVLEGFRHPHTLRFDHLMTRRAGQRRFINVHMHVPPTWTLGRADDLRHQVEHALAEAVPGLHASIQMLPDGVQPITVDLNEPLEGAPESLHAH